MTKLDFLAHYVLINNMYNNPNMLDDMSKMLDRLLENRPAVIRCKDCRHFEIKDHWVDFEGISVLAASNCPTCNKWADGCKTNPDGYCYLGEKKEKTEGEIIAEDIIKKCF